jgi:hypothetical protein
MNLEFDKATLEDALYIAANLRPSDREECNAHTDTDAPATLKKAWEQSSHAWTVKNIEGAPVAILGLVPAPGLKDTGIPWLLCTEEADAMPKAFAWYAQEYLDVCHAIYPKLFNLVPSTSTKTLAWLERLGFTLGKPMPCPKGNSLQLTPFFKEIAHV